MVALGQVHGSKIFTMFSSNASKHLLDIGYRPRSRVCTVVHVSVVDTETPYVRAWFWDEKDLAVETSIRFLYDTCS